MEDIGQAYGWILYRTHLKADAQGELVLDQLHSYAQVYVNKKLVGTIDRRLNQDRIAARREERCAARHSRREHGPRELRQDDQRRARWNHEAGHDCRQALLGWEIYPLTMTHADKLRFREEAVRGPCFYRGSFDLGIDRRHLPRHQRLHQGPAMAQRPRAWAHLELGPQRDALRSRSVPEQGRNDTIVFDAQGKMGGTLRGSISRTSGQ